MIQTWQCPDCKRHATGNITKCRNCGRVKPTYGIVDPEAKPERKTKRKTKRSKRKGDPLISDNEEQIYVSTLKFADGRTFEDIDKSGHNNE